MGLLEDLQFEVERRVILFKSSTTMPDGSSLGYNGNPNSANPSNSDGEFLLYNSPTGTRYQEDDGTQWYKKLTPNTWETFGGGSISDLSYYVHTQTTSSNEWNINHNLDSQTLKVDVWVNNELVLTYVKIEDNNNITVKFNKNYTGKVFILAS